MPVLRASSSEQMQWELQDVFKPVYGLHPTYRGVVYKTIGKRELTVDIYVPDTGSGNLSSSADGPLVPGVLSIHGGGWMTNGHSAEEPYGLDVFGEAILGQGMAVISVEYRLIGEDDAPTFWPAQGDDVADAMKFLRNKGQDFGVDPGRLGCSGHSSGGHLCAWLATAQGIESARPEVAVALSPPTCFLCGEHGRVLGQHPADWLFGFDEGTLASLKEHPDTLGEDAARMFDLVHSSEPLWHVQNHNVSMWTPSPLLLVHGKEDDMVPPVKSRMLKSALTALGYEVHALFIKDATHDIMSLLDGKSSATSFLEDHFTAKTQDSQLMGVVSHVANRFKDAWDHMKHR